mgnify:CR=1 FL=1
MPPAVAGVKQAATAQGVIKQRTPPAGVTSSPVGLTWSRATPELAHRQTAVSETACSELAAVQVVTLSSYSLYSHCSWNLQPSLKSGPSVYTGTMHWILSQYPASKHSSSDTHLRQSQLAQQ